MDNLEDFSFKEIINNEKLVNDFIDLKRKDYNYQEFIFDTIPNFTFYEDDTYEMLRTTNFKTINDTFSNLINSNLYEKVTDEYSFFMNHPLQSLTFTEPFESANAKKKIYENCETIEEVINFIGLPYESLINDNEEYCKIKSGIDNTQQLCDGLDQFNSYNNNKSQWDSSKFTIDVDSIQQLNPDKYKEFIEYSFIKDDITKNSIKLSILGIILNTKKQELLKRLANDNDLLNGLITWLKKEIKKPSSVLMYVIEVLNFLPITLSNIKNYQFEKYLNEILAKKDIENETKKVAIELKENWKNLQDETKSHNNTKKPTIININTSQKNNKSDLFNKILSSKKSPITPTSSTPTSSSSTSSTSTSSSTPTPTENNNINDTSHHTDNNTSKNSTFRNKFIVRKASSNIISSANTASSKPMYQSPTAFIVGNNTFNNNNNTTLDNVSMFDNPYLKDPRKRVSPMYNGSLNGVYKRFKTSTNDSLNNISYTQITAKPVVPILKKSSMKKPDAPKKRVTFKPDGTMTQYRIIYNDGRDLKGRALKNARFNK